MKKNQHIYFTFKSGEAVLDSQLRPRMYMSIESAKKNYPAWQEGKAEFVEYAPVKQGKWIYNTDEFSPHMRCSICGYNKPIAAGENIKQEPFCYCCNCGAKMELEGKE